MRDVLSLFKLVDSFLDKSGKIKHILKGIDDDESRVLAAKSPQTVADAIQLCPSYDELRGQRASTRQVDVHLLRTAILHREIMECELQKVLRTADRELTSTCFCLHDIFVKEGIGYWLAEHLDLIWSEFGNQVQKGVVNLHKAEQSQGKSQQNLRLPNGVLRCGADEMSPLPRTSEAGRLGGDCSARREMALQVSSGRASWHLDDGKTKTTGVEASATCLSALKDDP
ncbi:hypothetical protein HPB51_015187 [Rhipicephalus microplus]|uniref:Uncharacterized protein n=1 Tax=Rhipicephalus microplus TaxID=6941 RepID=A0A9J6F5A8_RHIMP|nr:hypothetical protein HPB51_015187 [Rhipicephalus microplus]